MILGTTGTSMNRGVNEMAVDLEFHGVDKVCDKVCDKVRDKVGDKVIYPRREVRVRRRLAAYWR